MKAARLGLCLGLACLATSALSFEWGSSQRERAAISLSTAFGSAELCDQDIDADRAAAIIRKNFGDRLSPDQAARLMYQIVVYEAVQGAQIRKAPQNEIAARCGEVRGLYGARGTELPGLIKP